MLSQVVKNVLLGIIIEILILYENSKVYFYILVLTITSTGNAQQFDDIDSLLKLYESLPKNKNQAIANLVSDSIKETKAFMSIALKGSSPEFTKIFVEALSNHSSNKEMNNLLVFLEDHPNTYLRILTEVSETVARNPKLLERYKKRIDEISKFAEQHQIPLPNIGTRAFNSALYIAGCISYIYGYGLTYLHPDTLHHFAEVGTVIPTFLMFHFFVNIVAEVNAILKGTPPYLRIVKEHNSAKTKLKNLKKLMSAYKKDSAIESTLKSLDYFSSGKVDQDLKEIYPIIANRFLKNWTRLKDKQIVYSFVQSEKFLKLTESLKNRLSPKEIVELQNHLSSLHSKKTAQIDLSNGLKMEIIQFSSFVQTELQSALAEDDKFLNAEFVQRLSEHNTESKEKQIRSLDFDNWDAVSFASLSIGITLAGLQVGLGKESSPLDALFSEWIMETMRNNTTLFLWTSTFFMMPALARFYATYPEAYRQFVKDRQSWKPFNLKHIDKLDIALKVYGWLIREKPVQEFRSIKPASTSDELIDRFFTDSWLLPSHVEVSCEKTFAL